MRGPLAEFWAVTQCGSSVGGIALHHYRAHPRTECLYQDPLLRLQIYAQKRQRIYLEQKKRKKRWDGGHHCPLPPRPSLSFHFRFHLRPFNTGGGLARRPPPPSACTSWLSAGSWTTGSAAGGRLVTQPAGVKSTRNTRTRLPWPHLLPSTRCPHWAGC